jgi:hypothetical protein
MRSGAVTVQISGLEGLAAAAQAMSNGSWALLEKHMLTAGERVAEGSRSRYLTANRSPDIRGSEGIRAEASAGGAFVVQTIRKSDFPELRRPNYGPRMMRKAYLPAAWQSRGYTLMQAALAIEEARALYWKDAPGTTIIV